MLGVGVGGEVKERTKGSVISLFPWHLCAHVSNICCVPTLGQAVLSSINQGPWASLSFLQETVEAILDPAGSLQMSLTSELRN